MARPPRLIVYEIHARRRMAARNVSEAQVATALERPDAVRPARDEHARRYEKAISSSRRLAVIAVASPEVFRVISVWWM